jgi:hypothetical protein
MPSNEIQSHTIASLTTQRAERLEIVGVWRVRRGPRALRHPNSAPERFPPTSPTQVRRARDLAEPNCTRAQYDPDGGLARVRRDTGRQTRRRRQLGDRFASRAADEAPRKLSTSGFPAWVLPRRLVSRDQFECIARQNVSARANDPHSETRRTGCNDCKRDTPDRFVWSAWVGGSFVSHARHFSCPVFSCPLSFSCSPSSWRVAANPGCPVSNRTSDCVGHTL